MTEIARRRLNRRVSEFGPSNALVGAMTNAVGPASSTGAILWGLGVAEVKTARRLARHGVPSLQVRLGGAAFSNFDVRVETYRKHGVEYCRAAMDKLQAEQGAGSFILMGNCAAANVCLAAALADDRVSGLIMSNPHVNFAQVLGGSIGKRLFRVRTWRNALGGRTALRRAARALGAAVAASLRKAADDPARLVRPAGTFDPLRGLPDDVIARLRALSDRGVSILIACAEGDDSFHYLSRCHGRALEALQQSGRVTFERVAAQAHVFSTDDAAAELLNDAVSQWIERVVAPAIARTLRPAVPMPGTVRYPFPEVGRDAGLGPHPENPYHRQRGQDEVRL
ncbi:MAG: hypothetical protein JXB36_07120 [Gammaproteobacteria bacterium]|nr:hypothetical protein [Gammaproteobacteria bacterium]